MSAASRSTRTLMIALAAVVALAGALACGAGGDRKDEPDAGPQAVASAPAAVTAPDGAVTAFADGTYEVGSAAGQVPPGKYKATAPANSSGCYWARLKGTGGTAEEVVANGLGTPGAPVVVTIAATDKAFETKGCGTWTAG